MLLTQKTRTQIYFLPGRGDPPGSGMGQWAQELGFEVLARAVDPRFVARPFAEQLELIGRDLQTGFCHPGGRLLAYSYGAYLLLHALSELPPYPGEVILISPMLGAFRDRQGFFLSRPPRARRLMQWAEQGVFPRPGRLVIHQGAQDPICDPRRAAAFASHLGLREFYSWPDQGHHWSEARFKAILRLFV